MTCRTLFLISLVLCVATLSAQAADSKPVTGPAATLVTPIKKLGRDDLDRDGRISKAEYLAAQEKRFAVVDTDHDGFISREEKKAHDISRRKKPDDANRDEKKGDAKPPAPTSEDSESFIKRLF